MVARDVVNAREDLFGPLLADVREVLQILLVGDQQVGDRLVAVVVEAVAVEMAPVSASAWTWSVAVTSSSDIGLALRAVAGVTERALVLLG